MNNPVVWFEIATIDIERARAFYTEVFQTTFERVDMPGTTMYMFKSSPDGVGAGGALVQTDDNTPSFEGAVLYFGSLDITTELERVNSAGGTVLLSKTSIGPFGFIALFADTEGNRIGLHSMA